MQNESYSENLVKPNVQNLSGYYIPGEDSFRIINKSLASWSFNGALPIEVIDMPVWDKENYKFNVKPGDYAVVLDNNQEYVARAVISIGAEDPEKFFDITSDPSTKLIFSITNIVGDGSSITYTTSEDHEFSENTFITVYGSNPSSYNKNKVKILSVTNDTFTISGTTTETYTSGAYVYAQARFDSNILLKYQDDSNPESILTINTYLDTNGYPVNYIQVIREKWENKYLGSDGWMLTAAGNAIFNNIAIRGEIDATTLNVGGENGIIYDGSEILIGSDVTINADVTVNGLQVTSETGGNILSINNNVDGTNDGIYINSHNYWYTDGKFSTGNSSKSLVWNGTDLTVTGTINSSDGNIGGWTINSTEIYSGSGSSKIALDSSNGKIYIGSGSYTNSNTSFYVDKNGQFSLGDKLFYNPGDAHSFGDLTVIGRIRGAIENTEIVPIDKNEVTITQVVISGTNTAVITATSHGFAAGDTVVISGLTGNSSILNGAFAIATKDTNTFTLSITGGTNGTYTGLSGKARVRELTMGLHAAYNGSPAGLGIRLDENNYWFVNNKFKVGSSLEYMTWDGSELTLTGNINATGGVFSGYVQAGNTKFGSNVSGTNDGIYINDINYWYDNTSFRTGTYSAFMNWDADRQTLGARGTLKTKTGELGGLNYGWLVGAGKIVGGGGASYMALQSGYYSTLATSIDDSSGAASAFNPGINYGDNPNSAIISAYGIPSNYVLAKVELSIYLAALEGDYVSFRNTDTDKDQQLQDSLRLMYVFNGSETENPFIEIFIPDVSDWHYTDLAGPTYNPATKQAIIVIVEDEVNYIIDEFKITYLGLDNGNGIYECEVYISQDDITGFSYTGGSPTQETINDSKSLKLLATKEFLMSNIGLLTNLNPLNDFNFFSEKNLYEELDLKFSIAFPGDGFLTYLDSNGNNAVAPDVVSVASDKRNISSIEKTNSSLVVTISSGGTSVFSIGQNIVFTNIKTSTGNTSLEDLLNHKKYYISSKTSSSITVNIPDDFVTSFNLITNDTYSLDTGKCSKNIFTLPSSVRDHSFWVGNENPAASGFALDSYGNVTKIDVHNITATAELKADKLVVRDSGVVSNLNAEKVNNVKITSSTTEPINPSTGDIWIVI